MENGIALASRTSTRGVFVQSPAEGVRVIFLVPLVLSVVMTAVFFMQDADWKAKAVAAGLVGVSIFLQFQPYWAVHFLIPLFLQLAVCIWLAIYFGLPG